MKVLISHVLIRVNIMLKVTRVHKKKEIIMLKRITKTRIIILILKEKKM